MTFPSFLASPEAECSICGVDEESPRRRCSRSDCWDRSACSSSLTSSSSLARAANAAAIWSGVRSEDTSRVSLSDIGEDSDIAAKEVERESDCLQGCCAFKCT